VLRRDRTIVEKALEKLLPDLLWSSHGLLPQRDSSDGVHENDDGQERLEYHGSPSFLSTAGPGVEQRLERQQQPHLAAVVAPKQVSGRLTNRCAGMQRQLPPAADIPAALERAQSR
jgi:hypothetical protein